MNRSEYLRACDNRLAKLVGENLNNWAELHMKKSGDDLIVTKIPCHSMEYFYRDDWRIKAGPDYLENPKTHTDTFTWNQMVEYLADYDLSTEHKIYHKPEEHNDIYWSNKFAEYEREQEAKAFLSDPDFRRA